jgi:hypothetical protein
MEVRSGGPVFRFTAAPTPIETLADVRTSGAVETPLSTSANLQRIGLAVPS